VIKAIIFDCDGTLVDSRQWYLSLYDQLRQHVGLPLLDRSDPQVLRMVWELANTELLDIWMGATEARTRAEAYLQTLDYDRLSADLRLEPGAAAVLASLRSEYQLAIASNREGEMASVVRRFGFEKQVDLIVCALDVDRPKPAPDMLLLAAERLGVSPGQALFVGDTDADRTAARHAGMAFLLYAPEAERGPGSDDGHPHQPLPRLAELPPRLAALRAETAPL